jgi:hypothetical protein
LNLKTSALGRVKLAPGLKDSLSIPLTIDNKRLPTRPAFRAIRASFRLSSPQLFAAVGERCIPVSIEVRIKAELKSIRQDKLKINLQFTSLETFVRTLQNSRAIRSPTSGGNNYYSSGKGSGATALSAERKGTDFIVVPS